jgi:hypothetical protein
VAELADAPDLGLQKHRFQTAVFYFKLYRVYGRKTASLLFPIGVLISMAHRESSRQSIFTLDGNKIASMEIRS